MKKFSLPVPQFDFICKARNGNAFGRFTVAHGDIYARLTHPDPREYLRSGSAVSLLLENGSFATLFGFDRPHSWSLSTPAVYFNIEKFHPHYAVIGHNEWQDTNRIFRIEFCLTGSAGTIGYLEHLETAFNSSVSEKNKGSTTTTTWRHDKVDFLKVSASEMLVTLSKQRQLGAGYTDAEIGKDPTWILINIPHGVRLSEIFQYVFHVRTFFEISAGMPSKAVSIAISTVESGHGTSDFSFFERGKIPDDDDRDEFPTDPAFSAHDQIKRDELEQALLKWIDRRKQWEVTYWLASSFVHGGISYDRQRLLRAFAWFESIPDYLFEDCVTKGQLDKLRPKIRELDEFKSLNVSNEHLSGVLSALQRRPLSERINTAIADLRQILGGDLVPSTLEQDCKLAKKLRDEAAHGAQDTLSDNFSRYVLAISAIETLAFLATIRNLTEGINTYKKVLNQIRSHPYASYIVTKNSLIMHEQNTTNELKPNAETIAAM